MKSTKAVMHTCVCTHVFIFRENVKNTKAVIYVYVHLFTFKSGSFVLLVQMQYCSHLRFNHVRTCADLSLHDNQFCVVRASVARRTSGGIYIPCINTHAR